MTIEVVGKADAGRYLIVCTDETCRDIIEFDRDDVKMITRSCMGRDAGSVQGISCPDCRQVLPFTDAEKLT